MRKVKGGGEAIIIYTFCETHCASLLLRSALWPLTLRTFYIILEQLFNFYLMLGASELVSWYFELSQPQRITSQPETMFNLSPIYSACKSSNHTSSKNHKISPDTNPHKTKKCTNIKQNCIVIFNLI